MQIDRELLQGRFRAAGALPAEEMQSIACGALAAAAAGHLKTLLLDFRELSIPRALSATECFYLGARLAQSGAGLRKVAFVTPQHCIPAHAFTLEVAGNRGLAAAMFAAESEALQWLRSTAATV